MKRIFITLNFVLMAIIIIAQVPAGISYQAAVRNTSGDIVANKTVKFKFSILTGSETGSPVYVETQSVTTNAFGLANLKVGMGTKISGTFDPDGWGDSKHYMKVELDPNNGNSFNLLGTSQLLSVPYAFYAHTVKNIPDNSVTSAKIADNAVINSKIINTAVTTDKLANNAVTAPKLASMGATTGQVLKWNGTAWAPGADMSGSSLWSQNGPNIFYDTGKVGIGKDPKDDLRQFQVLTEAIQAIAGVNNSASYATIFGQNLGAGPAADFRNRIRIADGTEGAGKVLTSDADGHSSWQAPASSLWEISGKNIYYNTGYVGIGFNNPLYNLDIREQTNHSLINLKAITNKDAIIYIDKGGVAQYSAINFRDQLATKFWIGLLNNDNMRISTHYSSLNGLEITSAGDANFTGMLNIHKGVASGQALLVNSKEAIWFDDTYFSWGYGGTANYFRNKIFVGASYAIPTQMLDVNGNARFRAIGSGAYSGVVNRTSDGTLTTATSDVRLKENISSLKNSLDKVMQLRGVSFTWKTNPEYGTRIGFIAQEFEKVIPELVFTNEVDGYKGINYAEVTAVLAEAVKEQQKIIEELKNENSRLISENENLKAKDSQLESRLEKLEIMAGESALK